MVLFSPLQAYKNPQHIVNIKITAGETYVKGTQIHKNTNIVFFFFFLIMVYNTYPDLSVGN